MGKTFLQTNLLFVVSYDFQSYDTRKVREWSSRLVYFHMPKLP